MLIQIKEILTEATKWKEMDLSKGSIKKIYKNNIPKTTSEISNGIELGTKNILNKHAPGTVINNSKMSKPDFKETGGGYYDYGTKTIHIDKDPNPLRRLQSPIHKIANTKDNTNLTNAIIGRHEAYEAQGINNAISRAIKTNKKEVFNSSGNVYSKLGPISKKLSGFSHQEIGSHNSANVLANENKDLKKLSYLKPARTFLDRRQKEYSIIKNNTNVDMNKPLNKSVQKKLDKYEANNNGEGYYIKN